MHPHHSFFGRGESIHCIVGHRREHERLSRAQLQDDVDLHLDIPFYFFAILEMEQGFSTGASLLHQASFQPLTHRPSS